MDFVEKAGLNRRTEDISTWTLAGEQVSGADILLTAPLRVASLRILDWSIGIDKIIA